LVHGSEYIFAAQIFFRPHKFQSRQRYGAGLAVLVQNYGQALLATQGKGLAEGKGYPIVSQRPLCILKSEIALSFEGRRW
jgi:hypothetical protein